MALNLDPLLVTNLVLAAAILILGLWIYQKNRTSLALYVAVGFGLFGVSHALTILGYGDLEVVLIPVRILGYLAVVAGLVMLLLASQRSPQRAKPAETRIRGQG